MLFSSLAERSAVRFGMHVDCQVVRDRDFRRTEFADTTVSMHFYDSIAVFERGPIREVQKVTVGGEGGEFALAFGRRRQARREAAERAEAKLSVEEP